MSVALGSNVSMPIFVVLAGLLKVDLLVKEVNYGIELTIDFCHKSN